MSKIIDGVCYKNMVEYAVRNLHKHVNLVNQLNVFPVPDGDTGTNMVTTLHKGLMAVGESVVDLPSVSRKFARSVVFEARGNSGVIVSQFLKGISEKFYDVDVADGALFIEALEKGVQYAYSAVATPVEGTMLTVIRDATEAVKAGFSGEQSVGQIIDTFVEHAKRSLENTPKLLSVLNDSGVVDSGGAGIVYMFEGMKKYLDGESLDTLEMNAEQQQQVDYDAFNMDSCFAFGYCTELLIQLLNGRKEFYQEEFEAQISQLGDSLVLSRDRDKVRIHIHTHFPEKVFLLCHQYGEFLSIKVENMTVQHSELTKRILCADTQNEGIFAIVAVAHDPGTQKLLLEMGADVCIFAEENVSTKDYLDAFEKCHAENIIVFPNSSDAILSAEQAQKLYDRANVTVIKSRSIAECYAALPAVDFEECDMQRLAHSVTEIIGGLRVVSIARRKKAIQPGEQNEYYSFSGKEVLALSDCLQDTAVQTIQKVIAQQGREIVTVFYRKELEETVDSALEVVGQSVSGVEFFMVAVDRLPCLMTISFE